MLRFAVKRLPALLRIASRDAQAQLPQLQFVRANHLNSMHLTTESEDCFNKRYVDFFGRSDIDGWEVRKGMNDLAGMDIIIHPKVAEAGLKACRQVNDIALAIRWLECIKEKTADDEKVMWPATLKYLRKIMGELGIPTLEDLGYLEPELWLKSVYDM